MSILESLFGPKKTPMECCYCATRSRYTAEQREFSCCQEKIPPQYRKFHREAKPLYVPLVGWASVGKTVWLYSVMRRLFELPATIWPDFAPLLADDVSMEYRRIGEGIVRSRIMPSATRPDQSGKGEKAHVVLLRNMPTWGRSRTLIVRDVAGENFEKFNVGRSELSFLKNSRTAFFMLCLQDIEYSDNKSMEELLQCYIHSLLDEGCDLRGRKIIVILAKADELKVADSNSSLGEPQKKLPANLHNYLITDPMAIYSNVTERKSHGPQEMANYVEKMSRVSDELKQWLIRDWKAQVMINMCEAHEIDLRFTAISATGSKPREFEDEELGKVQKLESAWSPFRVLDPLFWALHLHST